MPPPAPPIHRSDVVVLGGGPAGAGVALCLTRGGASVILIQRPIQRHIVGESLPPAAVPLLQELGLWDRLQIDGHRPSYRNQSLWGSDIPQDYDFMRTPHGTGWTVDRCRFDASAVDAARAAGVIYKEGRVLACEREADGRWRIILDEKGSRSSVTPDFLVDATGRARWVSRSLGIRRRAHDRLVGAVRIVERAPSDEPVDPTMLVEAVENGWWYTTSLPDGRLLVAYLSDADFLVRARAHTHPGWRELFDQTTLIRERVAPDGSITAGEIRRVSADSSQAGAVWGDGWCAVGDAAAGFDPLSSQGLVTALASGIRASQAILSGSASALGDYERWWVQVYARYLAQWLCYYEQEQRWSGSPFWQRRHALLQHLLDG